MQLVKGGNYMVTVSGQSNQESRSRVEDSETVTVLPLEDRRAQRCSSLVATAQELRPVVQRHHGPELTGFQQWRGTCLEPRCVSSPHVWKIIHQGQRTIIKLIAKPNALFWLKDHNRYMAICPLFAQWTQFLLKLRIISFLRSTNVVTSSFRQTARQVKFKRIRLYVHYEVDDRAIREVLFCDYWGHFASAPRIDSSRIRDVTDCVKLLTITAIIALQSASQWLFFATKNYLT